MTSEDRWYLRGPAAASLSPCVGAAETSARVHGADGRVRRRRLTEALGQRRHASHTRGRNHWIKLGLTPPGEIYIYIQRLCEQPSRGEGQRDTHAHDNQLNCREVPSLILSEGFALNLGARLSKSRCPVSRGTIGSTISRRIRKTLTGRALIVQPEETGTNQMYSPPNQSFITPRQRPFLNTDRVPSLRSSSNPTVPHCTT